MASVFSYVFWSKSDPQNSRTAQAPALEDSSSTSTQVANAAQSSSPTLKSTDESTTTTVTQNGSKNLTPAPQSSSTKPIAKKTAPTASNPRKTIADILEGVDLSQPGERERVVAEMRKVQEDRKAEAERVAREKGWPIRMESPNGSVREIAGLGDDGQPIYLITHNANAAISTGANVLQANPYSLTGLNLILGVWDGGSVRASHQEFGGRVSVRDGSAPIDHATHVGGTMIAAGVTTSVKGMAPSAKIDSYNWTSDLSEMTAAAAATQSDTNKILISNHSYGYVAGWVYVGGGSPYRVYEWYGNGTTSSAVDIDFGVYNTPARDSDALAYSSPFYLMFRSAGNDRADNPSNGQAVGLSANAASVVTYDSSVHPAGDSTYRNGYETVSYDALAKNVITIGSITDALSGSSRSPSSASLSGFSSTGPTDDGRIKPDVVANGDGVYSTMGGSDTAYGTMSGTSMSSPNAAGSAALAAQEYIRLFGRAMRSSTLKGLLIHTADDLGNPGPDYQFGWGLVNARAAADLVRDHSADPAKNRLTEGQVTTVSNQVIHEFRWDKTNPIRVTLAWTDPAGPATTSESRTARLVNNLNLRLVSPSGTTHLPYVMPFVGNWTQAAMASNAITGTNNTDNVEQVYLTNPPTPGVYRAIVTYSGTLSNSLQAYSLLVSGSSSEPLGSLTPTKAYVGSRAFLKISGTPSLRDTPESYLAWTNGSGAVAGFGSWSLSSSGTAGFFLSSTPAPTNMHVGSAKGLGLYANPGSTATASRIFSTPLGVGGRFALKFDNNWLQTGSQTGFSLADSNGVARFRFYFVGGEQYYRISDATTGRMTSVPYTDAGLSLSFTLVDANTYLLDAGNGYSLTGTLASGAAISRLIISAAGTGSGSSYDTYVGEMSLSGAPLGTATQVRLVRTGQPEVTAVASQLSNGELMSEFNLQGVAAGTWDLVLTNSDGSQLSLPASFTVEDAFWSESFDGTISGWTTNRTTGTTGSWSLTTNPVDSPPQSYWAPAPASKTTLLLSSPGILIPTNAANLQLKFRHWYNLQSSRDGGRLELSTNNGSTWFATDAAGSGVNFSLNGYNSTLGGNASSGSDFRNLAAWSGNSGAFVDSTLNLTDTAKFAGKQVRFRWILASDSSTASTGWYLDNLALVGTLNTPASIPATVTLGNLSQTYDGNPKSITVTTVPANLSVSVTYNGLNTPPTDANTYAVTATVTSPGYTGSASGSLVINQASQTILFGAFPTVPFGSDSFDAGASATSALPVSYSSSDPSVASVDPDGTIHVLTMGSTTITASQAGDVNYAAATPVNQILTVEKGVQVITFDTPATARVGESRTLYATAQPSGLPVTLSSSDASIANLTGSQVSFAGPGSVTLTASQAGNSTYLAASNVSVLITVGGLGNPDGDTDGDGLANLLEYALPTDTNGPVLPHIQGVSNGLVTMTALVRTNDAVLTYQPLACTDLSSSTNWIQSGIHTNIPVQTNVPAGFQRREYQFNAGTNTRAFLKLTIQQQ